MALSLSLILAGAAALYTLSAISHVFYMYHRGFEPVARWATRLAWLTQSIGMILLIATTDRAPVHTLFEFAYLFTWIMVTIFIVMFEVVRSNQAAGAFLMPVVAMLQVVGVLLPKPSPEFMVSEQFSASVIGWHIGVIGLGYVFCMASFVAGALYILQERYLRRKSWGPLYYRLPSLETLDIWGGRFVYVGFLLLTIGMGAGFVFAEISWQRLWSSDPKVVFTVFCWLVYGGYLLIRRVWGWGGRRAAWWSVVGAVGLLVNYFVMSLVSNLHNFVR